MLECGDIYLFEGWGGGCDPTFLIFNNLQNIMVYNFGTGAYIYKYFFAGQFFCGFNIFNKLGVQTQKFKNTLQVGIFKNRTKSKKKI